MKKTELSQFQIWGILGGAAIMLSLAMGMRQSFGLLQPHMIRDIGITAADFSMAVALQNIVWGATQPVVGIWADKYGTRPVALVGVLIYILGLLFLTFADAAWMVTLGIGFCVGIALSCTASNIAMNITARTVSPLKRGAAMGAVSAIGSLGLTIASPMAQSLIGNFNWQMAAIGFLGLACVMLPAAFWGSKADQIEPEAVVGKPQSATDAITEALGHKGYRVLAIAFFVCGLQLVFITTHLPAYLDICGMDPTVGSNTLALVGLFNVIGSYLFGWLGDRYSKRMLLGSIYMLRSLALFMFFSFPPSPTTTLIFGAVLGTLWLGVVPLVSGLIVHLFGLRFMATLSGIAFMSHQVGSFLGAWGGGYIFNLFGNYDLAWKLAVAIGLAAGLFQMTMNTQPSERIRNQLAT
ncbi:MFS transporter [Limnohabitans sp. MMS-10A-178]|jgi:predicted MFS family arabinose efflux permease|uniref:MFS transporter n=1 Tax=Limnohabitans sp. MMS-10A-178 TaxID=1835767 RepID=UPI000D387D3F|nr:MFS transporter [Limnohabitans sp. MMS-10A-178]PUE14918.1 MFS transporter [Limnohabitans sp. MMS-10A-178]